MICGNNKKKSSCTIISLEINLRTLYLKTHLIKTVLLSWHLNVACGFYSVFRLQETLGMSHRLDALI